MWFYCNLCTYLFCVYLTCTVIFLLLILFSPFLCFLIILLISYPFCHIVYPCPSLIYFLQFLSVFCAISLWHHLLIRIWKHLIILVLINSSIFFLFFSSLRFFHNILFRLIPPPPLSDPPSLPFLPNLVSFPPALCAPLMSNLCCTYVLDVWPSTGVWSIYNGQ